MSKGKIVRSEEMPKVSRQELGDNLDLYLERVSKEEIAFLITDDGKPDLVLCPAWWFTFHTDQSFKKVVLSAVKGAIRGSEEEVKAVTSFIRQNLDVIDPDGIYELIFAILAELESHTPPTNNQKWREVLLVLEERKKKLGEHLEMVQKARMTSEEDKVTMDINIDTELLKKSEAALVRLGMSLDDAISLFLEEVVKREAIPFEIWEEKENN